METCDDNEHDFEFIGENAAIVLLECVKCGLMIEEEQEN